MNTFLALIAHTPLALAVVLAILAVAVALYVLSRRQGRMVQAATRRSDELQSMMQRALDTTGHVILDCDMRTGTITNRYGTLLPPDGLTAELFAERLHPDDRTIIPDTMSQLGHGVQSHRDIHLRLADADGHTEWRHLRGHAIAERDAGGLVRNMVCMLKDVTADMTREQQDSELASKYVSIFDSTLIAMSFYSPDGRLLDLNENMRRMCGFDAVGEQFFRQMRMFDLPLFRDDFDPRSHDDFHACQHMRYPEVGIDHYIEYRVRPIYDGDALQYYSVTAHDVTAERQMYLEQQRHEREVTDATEQLHDYEVKLRYLLENSQMWVWRSSIADHTIGFTRSLQKLEFTQTFDEYLACLFPDQVEKAMKSLGGLRGTEDNFNVTLRFMHTPVSDGPQWVAISGIPMHDADGRLTGHFGIVRDVTMLMLAQEQLQHETARAEDSGKLKSVFLANMTHEIRTPLNAIVGFSDLLPLIDAPEERREFIRIIRNNCDMLIRLIDDIIEASNMNQGPLAIEPAVVDFSVVFNDICQSLAQRVQEPGVQFIVDNPYATYPAYVDKGRMQQVITNFTTNAVKYTHKGHIKVGYKGTTSPIASASQGGAGGGSSEPGLLIYCEDTGAGIPKDKQASVFDRFVKLNDFVQGTGLGLSICKSIADRCGGHIGVESEGEGHGSTFWLWVPNKLPTAP